MIMIGALGNIHWLDYGDEHHMYFPYWCNVRALVYEYDDGCHLSLDDAR